MSEVRRVEDLFEYFGLLVSAKANDHRVTQEIDEVIREIKRELGIEPKISYIQMDQNGLYIKGGSISIKPVEGVTYTVGSEPLQPKINDKWLDTSDGKEVGKVYTENGWIINKK